MIDSRNKLSIPELNFRSFRGASDYPQIALVLTASEQADQTERSVSAEDIANAYQHLSNCDSYKDILIAEVAGQMVGYARGWWETEESTTRFYKQNGFLLPEWRRRGIGQVLFQQMEDRLREIAATHPRDIQKIFQVNISQFQKGTGAILENSGYQPIRYFYNMVRPTLDDIREFPLPAGLEVRSVLPEHYPAIWKSVDETSQDEWGYKTPTVDEYQEWLASDHFQPHLWQVAWDTVTERVVGHVLTFIDADENDQFNRKRGYTEGIGVDRAWRRRGLARALISRSLQAQKTAGMTESALVADGDSENNVTRLYESCGFQIVKYDMIYRKPIQPTL